MVYTAMHMAVGMATAGAIGLAICMVARRGWRWVPLMMTAGAIWAIIPDLPALIRTHLHDLPLVGMLGSQGLETLLRSWGDVFFGHRLLHAFNGEPTSWSLAAMALLYSLSVAGLVLSLRRGHEHALDDLKLAAMNAGHRMQQVRSSHLSRSA